MNPAPAFRCCSALLVLTVASFAGSRVRADNGGLTDISAASLVGTSAPAAGLTPNSPFAPPNSNAASNAMTANSPLELHGILSMPDGDKFNLCDQAGHVNV